MSQQMKEGEDNKDVTLTIEEKELQKRSRQLQLPNTGGISPNLVSPWVRYKLHNRYKKS